MSGKGGEEDGNFLRRSELCEEERCNICRSEERESIPVTKDDISAVCPVCKMKFDVFYKMVCKINHEILFFLH